MGEVFAGRYELVDPIGHGGVGAVWRSWDHRRRRYVAAKVLQQSDAHALLRFVREQALRIDHPHVLAPASWAADDDKVLLTMDLVAGGSLAHVIGDYGPLPPPFVCTLLDQLLSGLAAVHAEGVVHRDIKPANILLEATGAGRPHLRLSDFGISMRKGEPRLTETDYVVGTPGYFAPEQMLGAEPDFTADLFAVGLVALYLLEGAKPDAKALIEYFAEHGTPRAPQGIPEPLWQVIATLLQPDPQTRFRTATGARKALASAAEMLPEPGPDDELIEIFDQLAPLPAGFGPHGPVDATDSYPHPHPRPRSAPRHARRTTAPEVPEAPSAPPPPPHLPPPATAPTPTSGPPTSGPATPATPVAPGPSHTNGFPLPPPVQPEPLQPPQPRYSPQSPHTAPVDPPAQSPTQLPARPPSSRPPQPSTPPTPMPLRTPDPGPGPTPPAPDPTYASAQAVTSSARRSQALTPAAAASTYPYTAQAAQVPPPNPPISQLRAAPPTPAPATALPAPQRRPGPPAKVAVPMLLVALACLAIGVWALTQL
ncbi:protein kinase [Streptomyces sp. SID335]|nr:MULTISPECIES: serine/threonine-protein kinase [unclassified Streptomyces]MYY84916.1 protein kinase [Streptomyces sp. SID335]NDZ88506.1 serine/threonine protein kinase [Streptomyces sp. SID10115]NEA00144.1 serine/threonine protein kinase [Streptomyces sp. SID10116]NEB48086.1 serine/threonine protein kinase [Streptomyces sp. SID339]